ncbi:MAG: glutamine-hydrolyzing carbamoyl-phosphate synthase small subunit [Bullifex sp.]
MKVQKAYLRLKDGTTFDGIAYGCMSPAAGEVVFNTSMTGYPEILSDPSYNGQMVVMTYPLIGNYGVDEAEHESSGIRAAALIVKKLYRGPVPEGRKSLEEYITSNGGVLIEGIDTRALTIHIREHGSQNGIIFTEGHEADAAAMLDSFPLITERDLISEAAVKEKTVNPDLGAGFISAPENPEYSIAVADYGIKYSIIEDFYKRGCSVTLLPPTWKSEDVLDEGYDMLFLSNGPGDPAYLQDTVKEIRKCIGKIPVRGICLGHQLITLALGGRTVKMEFGHHGGNQPVLDVFTGKTFVTSQNHGFMSDEASFPEGAEVWLRNANDGSVEGLVQKELNVMSVQFHPEASPGPHDRKDIFDIFLKEL